MSKTGWTGEPPDAESPAMPVTSMLLSGGRGERQPGSVLEQSLARAAAAERLEAREAAASAPDPDETAAAMVARGYTPGLLHELSQRLADATAELEAERQKIERGERREESVRGMLSRGQVGAMEASRMLDGDFGDHARAAQLERRAESLQRQLGEASAMIAPQAQREPDAVEAASRRAHRVFVEATRARMEPGPRSAPPARRPFGYASRGAGNDDQPVTCPECAALGANAAESFVIHHPELLPQAYPDIPDGAATERHGSARGREITRAGQ